MTNFVQAVEGEEERDRSFPRKKLEKPYCYRFWYPIFPSSYRTFCRPWWLHWVTPRHYIQFFSIKWQRMSRGYADCDLWNMNDTLAYLLHEMTADFTEIHHGYPCNTTAEEYQKKLVIMIGGFQAMHELLTEADDQDFRSPDYKLWTAEREARWAEGIEIFKDEFSGLWD